MLTKVKNIWKWSLSSWLEYSMLSNSKIWMWQFYEQTKQNKVILNSWATRMTGTEKVSNELWCSSFCSNALGDRRDCTSSRNCRAWVKVHISEMLPGQPTERPLECRAVCQGSSAHVLGFMLCHQLVLFHVPHLKTSHPDLTKRGSWIFLSNSLVKTQTARPPGLGKHPPNHRDGTSLSWSPHSCGQDKNYYHFQSERAVAQCW